MTNIRYKITYTTSTRKITHMPLIIEAEIEAINLKSAIKIFKEGYP